MCVCRLESHRRSSGCMHPGRRVLRTAQLCRFVGTTSTGHTRRTAVPLPTRPNTHRALVLVSTSAALYTGGWSYGRNGKEQIFSRKRILGIRRTEINLPTRVCVYGCGPLYCPGGVYLLLDVIAAHVCISVQLYNSYSLLRQLP